MPSARRARCRVGRASRGRRRRRTSPGANANGRSSARAYGSTSSFAGLKRWPCPRVARTVRAQSVARRPATMPSTKPWKTSPVRCGQRDARELRAARVVEDGRDSIGVACAEYDGDIGAAVAASVDAERLGGARAVPRRRMRQCGAARARERRDRARRSASPGALQPTSVAIARAAGGATPRGRARAPRARAIASSRLLARHRRELDAGADARRERHLVGVDDRVGEAADARDDRESRRSAARRAASGRTARSATARAIASAPPCMRCASASS